MPMASIFYVHEQTGQVRVKSAAALKADRAFTYTLPIMVWDTGRPEKTATSTFTAKISRNENSPRFEQNEYRVKINDRYELGQEIVNVQATDRDQVRFHTSVL